ncbi:MAG: hypothetical protein R8J94_07445 [Acidimicrobiia bacterium]|nr:hypothetical protein [Acidimicrobiia bacterium]
MVSLSADSSEPSRRALLKKGAAVAGVAWTAPVILTWTEPVAAAVGSGGGSYTYCFDAAGDPEGWTMNGLWNINSSRSVSPSFSLHYGTGTGGTYESTGTNSGTATSPAFVVPTSGSTIVEFDVWREVEVFGSGTWDELSLSVLPGGSVLYAVSRDGGTGGLWEHITVDLAGFAGSTVQLVFAFDTGDANYNDFEGIYIDNIVVPGATPPGGGSLSASPLSTRSLGTGEVWMPDRPKPTASDLRRRDRATRDARTSVGQLPEPAGEAIVRTQ